MSKSRAVVLLAGLLLLGGCAADHHTHVAPAMLPEPVVNGFHEQFPGLAISHADRVAMPDNTAQYEIKFRDAKNAYHRKTFTSDGRLLGDKSNVALPATK